MGDRDQEDEYSYHRHNIYRSKNGVILKRGSLLEEDVIIGSNCTVDEDARISHSSIGSGTTIGKNVLIDNCIIHERVVIGDNSVLTGCVLGCGVKIGSHVKINEKSVLGPSVVIDSNVEIPPKSFIADQASYDEDDDDDFFEDDGDKKTENATTGGEKSSFGPKAFPFKIILKDSDDSEDEDDEDDNNKKHDQNRLVSDLWGLRLNSDDDGIDSSSDESVMSEDMVVHSTTFVNEDDHNYDVFNREVHESLSRGAEEGVKPENLILEVNSSKHAYNMTLSQVNTSITTNLILIGMGENNMDTGAKLLGKVKKTLKDFVKILKNYIKSSSAEIDCLTAVGSVVGNKPDLLNIASKIVQCLYDMEIVEDETVIKWYSAMDSGSLKDKLKPFITWLEETESEGSDSEEESD